MLLLEVGRIMLHLGTMERYLEVRIIRLVGRDLRYLEVRITRLVGRDLRLQVGSEIMLRATIQAYWVES